MLRIVMDYLRLLLPILTGYLALVLAYAMGVRGANDWLLIFPMLMVSYAIGLTADRAENRAKGELFNIFLAALTSNRNTTITVKTKSVCGCDQEGCGCA